MDDLGEVYELYDDDEIRKYMEPLYEYGEEKKFTESYIKNMYGMYGFGMWLVKDRDTDKLIGRAGLELRLIDGVEEMELGYIIGKNTDTGDMDMRCVRQLKNTQRIFLAPQN